MLLVMKLQKKKRSIAVDRYSISKARYVHGKTIIQLVWKLNTKKKHKREMFEKKSMNF